MTTDVPLSFGEEMHHKQLAPAHNSESLHIAWAQESELEPAPASFDALLHIVKARFRVSTAVVLMSRGDVTVINMRVGLAPSGYDCKAALAQCRDRANHLFVIEDAAAKAIEAPGAEAVRFYAGAPLVIRPGGPATGMLCLVDNKPRGFSRGERMLLGSLARAFSALLLMPHHPAAALTIAMSAEKSMLLLGEAQTVESVNPRFTEVTGFAADDLLTVGVDDLLCLGRPSSGSMLISHALIAEKPVHGMTRCHTKAGGTLPVEVFVFPLSDLRGQVAKTLLLVAPLFSGPLEEFLLSLRSNERNQLLALHVAGLWSIDNAGLISRLSGAPIAHLNETEQDGLLGKRLDMTGIFDAALTHWDAFYKSIAAHTVPDEVECCVTHNGYSQWYSMVGFRQHDERGQALGYHGSFRNITRRKLKETALRHANESQQLILKGVNDGAWDWDLQTGEYYLSPRWWEMMGREPETGLPTTNLLIEFIHPDDRDGVAAKFKAAIMEGHDSYETEFRMLHLRGHYVPVMCRGHILRNAHGIAIRTSGANQDLTAQRAAQAEIRLLQSCVENQRDVVLITHASPRKLPGPIIAYVNPAFEAATGYSAREVMGKTPRLLQGPETCRQTLDKISAALQAWQGIRCELINYKKSGEMYWVELDLIPFKSENSAFFTHWIGVQRDVTERKYAEQALRTTTARLNLALEASGLGLWTTHSGRNECFRDSVWHSMLGDPPQDTTTAAEEWLKLVHPDDMNIVKGRQLDAMYSDNTTFDKEFRLRHRDGHWVWIQSRGKVIERDQAGKPVMLAGTHLDITTKVEARLLAQRLNEQLTRCLEHLHVGVILQRNGIVKFVNSTLLHIFGGADSAEFIGTKFSDYILPGDIASAVWRQEQLMAGATLPSFWFNCLHSDGRVIRALTNSTVIEWEGERHILSTMTPPGDAALLQEDVEKTRSLYERLLANQVEKEQVTIAHELHDSLGSQLASISLQTAGLKLLSNVGQQQKDAVDELLVNIKTASEMTRTLARGLAPVDDWPGAFWRAIKKLCDDFSSTKGLRCEFEMTGDFEEVRGLQANHLYRIVQEAITNAVRHGTAKRIDVQLVRDGNNMEISVSDDGTGFEVRSTLAESRKGVGLSSMYARAQAIGGSITLKQLAPRGVCVVVNWSQEFTGQGS